MVEKDRIIKLTNRDTGTVGYTLEDTGAHRRFTAGETKEITFDELERLSWAAGGKELLRDYLIIQDKEAAEEILGHVEPEYFYTKDTIKKLLTQGTLEQLQDTLNFGPKGVIDLVKQEAVELQVNNVAMRKEIQKQTSFNVDRAIEINEESKKDGEENNAETVQRKSQPITEEKTTTTARNSNNVFGTQTASDSKYKIVGK